MFRTDQLPFSALSKKYEMMCQIGEGISSSVYKVYNQQYQRHFAAKIIEIPEDDEKAVTEMVNNEVSILNSVNHPNIIKIYDFFREGRYFFIIFDDCSSGRLETHVSISRFIAPPQLQFYALKILQAVHCCHTNNIAHCQINATNILIDGHDQPKLIHFRNAVSLNNQKVCNEPNFDIRFSAPETLLSEPYDGEKADIWSLGITFFYMATGTFPYSDQSAAILLQKITSTPIEFPEDFPEDLHNCIVKMLEIRPNRRPSASDLLNEPFFANARKVKIKQTSNSKKKLSSLSGQTCKSMLQPQKFFGDDKRIKKRNSMIARTNSSLI